MAEMPQAASKILLLDDEKDFCDLFKAQFEKRGFQVLTCSLAAQALECIIKEKPQCLILDIHLQQGENGLTVLRQIRGFRSEDLDLEFRVRRLPVIVLTSASPNMKELFLAEGASDFIEKPYDSERIKIRIIDLISQYNKES